MATQKTKHLRCRIDRALHQKIRQGADHEDTTDSEFARRLLDWAAGEYALVGKLSELVRLSVRKDRAT